MRRCQTAVLLVLLLAAGLTVTGCRTGTSPTVSPTPSRPSPQHRREREWWVGPALGLRLAPADFPRLDASTSAEPLVKMVVGTVMGKQMVRMSPPGAFTYYKSEIVTKDVFYAPNFDESNRLLGSVVKASGTHGAYEALIKHESDLIVVARAPSADETKLSQEQKVPLDVREVALDAFVFIVNRHNPVQALSVEQIRGIYAGSITNWSQLGGPRRAIDAYQREANSGSQELMESLVMQGQAMAPPGEGARGPLLRMTMRGPFYALLQDRWGLGYTVFYYEENLMYESEVAVCAVNQVVPSTRTIETGEYPLIAPVYVVVRKDAPAGSTTRRLRDWLLGQEGQMVVDASGYVSLDSARRRRGGNVTESVAPKSPVPAESGGRSSPFAPVP